MIHSEDSLNNKKNRNFTANVGPVSGKHLSLSAKNKITIQEVNQVIMIASIRILKAVLLCGYLKNNFSDVALVGE